MLFFSTISFLWVACLSHNVLQHLSKQEETGQKEREESTQNTTVTNSAAYASYKIKATT
jgi:hypothetical protein